jgi:hypothetical protein
MAWTIQQMNQSNALLARDLQALRQFVDSMPDAPARAQLERVVQNIQRQVGPASLDRAAAPAVPGGVAAASQAPGDPQLVLDPDEAYTQEVKNALLDAMITYGAPLAIGPDEWLTVAARDNAPVNPLVQSDADFRTIMFRLKGSDLLEYQTQRLTLDQVKERVTIAEF